MNANTKFMLSDPIPSEVEKVEQPHWGMYRRIVEAVARPGTVVDFTSLRKGYFSAPTTPYRTAYNAIGIIHRAYEAEKRGYDGFLIGCASDPGLREARALVNIPVVAPLESASLLASTLGNKFSIVLLEQGGCPLAESQIRSYGLRDKLASVRYVPGVTVATCFQAINEGEENKVIDQIVVEIRKAVRDDSAEAAFVGCTIGSSLLTMQGIHQVENAPVIDIIAAEIKMAEIMVDLRRAFGITQCKATIYHPPPPGWEKEMPIPID